MLVIVTVFGASIKQIQHYAFRDSLLLPMAGGKSIPTIPFLCMCWIWDSRKFEIW